MRKDAIGWSLPWDEARASTTDAELHDLYTYLHSLPPVESATK